MERYPELARQGRYCLTDRFTRDVMNGTAVESPNLGRAGDSAPVFIAGGVTKIYHMGTTELWCAFTVPAREPVIRG